MDMFGPGFTLLVFGENTAWAGTDDGMDERMTVIRLASDSSAARVYGAGDGDTILIRPDRFIAARWQDATPAEIIAALDRICRGGRAYITRNVA